MEIELGERGEGHTRSLDRNRVREDPEVVIEQILAAFVGVGIHLDYFE